MFKHDFVKHSEDEYVVDKTHTNTIEGFFSEIVGTYHFVSEKHLDMYLKEVAFRYNTKKETEENRFNLLLANCGGRLTYQDLIS